MSVEANVNRGRIAQWRTSPRGGYFKEIGGNALLALKNGVRVAEWWRECPAFVVKRGRASESTCLPVCWLTGLVWSRLSAPQPLVQSLSCFSPLVSPILDSVSSFLLQRPLFGVGERNSALLCFSAWPRDSADEGVHLQAAAATTKPTCTSSFQTTPLP